RISVAPLYPSSRNCMAAGTTAPSAVTRSRKAATWLAIVCAAVRGSGETRAEMANWGVFMMLPSFLQVASVVHDSPVGGQHARRWGGAGGEPPVQRPAPPTRGWHDSGQTLCESPG